MAIAFDAASTANTGITPKATLTWSHTCSGTNRLLIVSVSIGGTQTVSGITYSGVALTLVSGGTATNGSSHVEKWYLIGPATGANDVVVTFSTSANAVSGAISYSGASQTTPLGTAASATGGTTVATVDVSSATSEIVEDAMCAFDALGAPTATVGASQTERWNASAGPTGGDTRGCGSTETGAATTTMSWTLSAVTPWAIVAVPVKAASAALRKNLHGRDLGASSDEQHYPQGGIGL